MDRKQHWENVYTKKSPLEVSWYQKEPRLSLELIGHCSLPKEAAIIDVGGGASLLVDSLLAEGYVRLSVLDISANALAHARGRLAGRGAMVEWIESDITTFAAAEKFDLWHDRAVFHFLTDGADRKKYLSNLKAALKPGGYLIIAAFTLGGPTQCSELDIVQYDAQKMSAELGGAFQLLEEMDEIHITPAAKQQHFAFFRYRYLG